MAVNFFNRLIVSGPRANVLDFRANAERWEIRAGKIRYRCVSDRRHEFHWDAARRKFHLEEDDVYEDEDATQFVELRMCEEALGSWEKRGGRPRRLNWERGQVFKTLDDERTIGMAAIAEELGLTKKPPKPKRALKQAGSRARKSRARSSSAIP